MLLINQQKGETRKMSKVSEYVQQIPEELRRAIRGLDSDYRAAIFVALYKHGESSFSELKRKLEINKAMLNYHLGKLTASGLVEHYYRHELGADEYSFYSVTQFGQNFLETLGRFLRPEPIYRIPFGEESSLTTIVRARARFREGFEYTPRRKTKPTLYRLHGELGELSEVDANKSGPPFSRELKTLEEKRLVSTV